VALPQCGACSVHHQRRGARFLLHSVSASSRANRIVTIEDFPRASSHPCRRPGPALDVPQCGYCQSGQIMAASALLKKTLADRRGHRRSDDQHLPLRHVSTNPRGRDMAAGMAKKA